MRNAWNVGGALCVLTGIVWILQGINIIPEIIARSTPTLLSTIFHLVALAYFEAGLSSHKTLMMTQRPLNFAMCM